MEYITHNLGYPRIGTNRELKRVLEAFWKGIATESELNEVASQIRRTNWTTQVDTGIDIVPVNDFSFYDHVLDTTFLLGNIPSRFPWDGTNPTTELYFRVARGVARDTGDSQGTNASEMSKWFDTNYHYIVPEFHPDRTFKLSSTKIFDELREFNTTFGIPTGTTETTTTTTATTTTTGTTTPESKVVLVGPLTYLYLGKLESQVDKSFDKTELFDTLLPVYGEVVRRLKEQNVGWVQFDEPILSLKLSEAYKNRFQQTYDYLNGVVSGSGTRLMVATYFGELRDNQDIFTNLPVNALHVDAVRGFGEVGSIAQNIGTTKTLSLGLIDGRNVWKTDYAQALKTIQSVRDVLGRSTTTTTTPTTGTTDTTGTNTTTATTVLVAPSSSLIHVPIGLSVETDINPELKRWLAFANEKLQEVVDVAALATEGAENVATNSELGTLLEANQRDIESKRSSSLVRNEQTQARFKTREETQATPRSPFAVRQDVQNKKYHFPLLPSTTIGSFPQTKDIRRVRNQFKTQAIDAVEYETFMKKEIETTIRRQEDLGLDVLVHGEAERNDMVEYFGEQLQGFAFTQQGWVQSYGSRYVKPPILYGDIWRPEAITVKWTTFAQSLTQKPTKGMLTGPITMMQWSFVRNDQAREATAKQLAYALNDEVLDLERAGITIIQVDEPALREGLPLREEDWGEYLTWAVATFQNTYTGVQDTTQIHTHMCYSEFGDILQAIADLDADVISMETSRSQMELLDDFANFKYPNAIGPGVYDIHSSRIPTVEEIVGLLNKALNVIPAKNLWVNPDCGLKTRKWNEVEQALRNMITATQQVRQNLKTRQEVT